MFYIDSNYLQHSPNQTNEQYFFQTSMLLGYCDYYMTALRKKCKKIVEFFFFKNFYFIRTI